MVAGTKMCVLCMLFAQSILVTKQDNNLLFNRPDPIIGPPFLPPFVAPRPCDHYMEFRCIIDGRCIPANQHCDRHPDCADHSDEMFCGSSCGHVGMFECHNGRCVHEIFTCDDENDCGDWSDEHFCQSVLDSPRKHQNQEQISCNSTQFFCDLTCVPIEWKCDGTVDCQTGVDEMDCNKTHQADWCKGPESFACGSQCLQLHWVCDGEVDCLDGSDEKNCETRDQFGECSEEHGFFECRDKKCLPMSKVCNNATDCAGGEDEGLACAQQCSSPCEYKCMQTPGGPHCICNKGYKLKADNTTCEDIDECHIDWSVCSQKCTNSQGSYTCSCYHGFSQSRDNHSCIVEGSAETVYFSLSSEVRSLAFKSSPDRAHGSSVNWEMSEIASDLIDPRSLSVDVHQDLILLIDGDAVFKVEKNGRRIKRILSNGLSEPESVAVDWISRNFYLTDSGTKQIIVCSLEYVFCTVILSGQAVERPRAVTLDPFERLMFWTDFSAGRAGSAYIGKSFMDGSEPQKLLTEDLLSPTTLAIDLHEKRVFWGDLETQKIESSDYQGRERRIIVRGALHPSGMDIFGDWLYWVDQTLEEIQRCWKSNGKNKEVVMKHADPHMAGISVAHHLKQRIKGNVCAESGCAHLCLPTAKTPFYKCACASGFTLSIDGKSCTVSNDQELVAIITGNRLIVVDPHILGEGVVDSHPLGRNHERVTSLAYDPLTNSVLFTESDTEALYRFYFGNGNLKRVCDTRSDDVDSIAIDHSTGNIYWLDGEQKEVVLLDPMAKFRKTLVTNLTQPSGLALVPELGFLFVADVGGVRNPPRIIKYSLDGRNAEDFIPNLPAPAESLLYDPSSETLYWTYEGTSGSIQSASVHSRVVNIYRKSLNNPSSLAVSSKFVYWVSAKAPALEWAEKSSMKSIKKLKFGDEEPENLLGNLRLITLIQPSSASLRNVTACKQTFCSHFCIPTTDGRHICECPNGMALGRDGATCVQAECPPSEFRCGDGECIDKRRKCDGVSNCANGEDELHCEAKCNTTSHFLCKNKDCISKLSVCDGENDCKDGSDEVDCTHAVQNCTEDEYRCKNKWQCINLSMLCDGQDDCLGESEEISCILDCPHGSTHCARDTRVCIPDIAICDGYNDCPEATDEMDCHDSIEVKNASSTNWKCPNGNSLCNDRRACVHDANICDGEEDCDDGSDELHCENHPHHLHGSLSCPPGMFSCFRGFVECVPMTALCNCSAECFHGEDELHCPPTSCRGADSTEEHYFTCPGHDSIYHIPRNWVCDGEADCPDDYDESHSVCNVAAVLDFGCPRSFFKCKNGQCIADSSVCDNSADCEDGSDEGRGCSRSCSHAQCSHTCLQTPSGPQCTCPPGYRLSKNKSTCEDIDECVVSAVRNTLSSWMTKHSDDEHPDLHEHHDEHLFADECAHTCENLKGAYKCKCAKGYRLMPDKHTCKADSRPHILFTTLHNLRSLKADWKIPEQVPVVAHSDDGIVDVEFDIEHQAIFWLTNHGVVHVANDSVITSHQENHLVTRYDLGLKNPQAFTYDWAAEEFFIAVRKDDLSYVKACKLQPSICATIHTTHSLITDLVADPEVKKLFWSEVHRVRSAYRRGVIGTMSLDGKQSWLFRDQGKVLYPVSLALDPIRRRVFWADIQKNTIECASYNGNGHSVIVRHLDDVPISISFFESRIYWISQGSSVLSYVSLSSKEVVQHKLPFHNIQAVVIHHHLLQPKAHSSCYQTPCSHICVDSGSKRGYTCACPEELVLDVSGHTCIALQTVKLLKNNSGVAEHSRGADGRKNGLTAASVIICMVLVAIAAVVFFAYSKKNKRMQRGQQTVNVSWLRFKPPTNNLAEDSLTLEDSLSIDYAEEVRRRQAIEQEKRSQYGTHRSSVKGLLQPVRHFAKKTASSAVNLASRARSSISSSLSSKSPLLGKREDCETVPAAPSGVFVDIPVNPYGDVSTDMLSPCLPSEEVGSMRDRLL